MLGMKHRFQEAVLNEGGNGGNNQQQQAPAEWLKPFGEHGKAFESFKEPGELAAEWTRRDTELTTLRAAKPQTFDWRKELAGDDADAQKMLGRFTDPKALTKSFIEAQNKIRSGDLAKPLPANATDDQVKEWRTANGIPLEPKGYFEKLPGGLVIGKEDQPIFDKYASLWHKHNLPPAAAHEMTKAYYEDLANVKKQEAAVDRDDALKTVTELRAKMGPDYDTNRRILDNWLEGFPGDLKARFEDATLGDGTRVMNDPAMLEILMTTARQLNPAAHLLPAGGEGNIANLESEIASIKKMMGDYNSDYHKGPKSAGLQKRYRELIEAQAQLKKRA